MMAFLGAVGAAVWLVVRVLLVLLGIAVALVLLLVLIPVSVRLRYSQQSGFSVRVRVMGIPLRVWPLPAWLEKRLNSSEPEQQPEESTPPAQAAPPPQPAPPPSVPQPAPAQPASKQPPAPAPEGTEQGKPGSQGQPAEPAPPPRQPAAAPADAREKEEQMRQGTEKLLALLRTAKGGLRLLFKGIWITVWLRWPVRAEDAAQTALRYGKANAWIGGAAAVLAHLFQFRLRQLELAPDFLGAKQGRGEVSCRITASLPVLAAAAVWTLVQLKKQKVF